MDLNNYKVTLERAGKQIIIVLRGSDYSSSVKFDRGNNPKMKYGAGAMWNIKNVESMNTPTFHHPTVAESRAELARELRRMADIVRAIDENGASFDEVLALLDEK